jgi:hypothetical protein
MPFPLVKSFTCSIAAEAVTIDPLLLAIDHFTWLLACGSKVYSILSFAVLRSQSAKPQTKERVIY